MFSLNPGTFAQMLTNESIIMCNIVRGREKGGVMVVRGEVKAVIFLIYCTYPASLRSILHERMYAPDIKFWAGTQCNKWGGSKIQS